MNNDLLKVAYSSDDFQKRGHQLIDELSKHLEDKLNEKSEKAIHWNKPEDELLFWKDFLKMAMMKFYSVK